MWDVKSKWSFETFEGTTQHVLVHFHNEHNEFLFSEVKCLGHVFMHRTNNVQVTLYIHITSSTNKFFRQILIQVQSFIKCMNWVIQGSSSNSNFSTIEKDLVIMMRRKYQIMQQKKQLTTNTYIQCEEEIIIFDGNTRT